MIEKIGHVKNPLTVIAMFAAIAEISGTIVLPFIEPDNQDVYVWFLMLFPVFLVGLFFLTLNFNHKALYAPSDYRDESNFVNTFNKASPGEQSQKLREELAEIEAEDSSENTIEGALDKSEEDVEKAVVPTPQQIHDARRRQLLAEIALAEKLAVNKLSKELLIEFKTDVRVDLPNYQVRAVFDGLGISENEVHAIEVKLFKTGSSDLSRLKRAFEQSVMASDHFEATDSKEFTIHIFVVVDSDDVELNLLKNKILELAKHYDVKSRIYASTIRDLQNEYQYNL